MAYENVQVQEVETGIHVLTVNRPKALNALNAETVAEIEAAARQLGADEGARVLIVRGAGEKAFVAGADIREILTLGTLTAKDWSAKIVQTFRALEELPIPVIAAVRGYCLGGGCELALSCDWIIAGDDAVFGLPEVGLGVIPGAGGTQRLPRIVGRARALELITTGRNVKAGEAKEMGLVNSVIPSGDVMEEALNVARAIASKGPVAVRLAKESVQRGQDLDLVNACTLENEVFSLCFSTTDQKEGMTAFVEKRKPTFRGN